MDSFSVLNYQGSKKQLLEYIHNNIKSLLTPDTTILDVFSGTCSVGYSFKRTNCIFANDCELYSYIISRALLNSDIERHTNLEDDINKLFYVNHSKHKTLYKNFSNQEHALIHNNDVQSLIEVYENTPTIWNTNELLNQEHSCFELFTTYYSTSYFGISQAMEIDSLRYAIENYKGTTLFYKLMAALFFAMKECVFSKDGHMAQPLNLNNNSKKLMIQRKKSIYSNFMAKINEFFSSSFVLSSYDNQIYNLNFEDLLKLPKIKDEVNLIYADPPYTDMQYSRYYHLLNIVANYKYSEPTLIGENYTKGLYINGRYQSQLSAKKTSLSSFKNLINYSKVYKKDLAISFAYPIDSINQKVDRYVMSIDDLIDACKKEYDKKNINVISHDYTHSNNRNSSPKKVLEYLILCKS